MSRVDRVDRYAGLADLYLENAAHVLATEAEPAKAGEFVWGAVVLGAKAAAATRGIRVTKYKDVSRFIREVARETGEPGLFDTFAAAEGLHGRFYEGDIDREDVAARLELARVYLGRLRAIAQSQVGKP